MKRYPCLAGLMMLAAVLPVRGVEPFYAIIEAEAMAIGKGWQVIKGREGYCPGYPNTWSGNRLRADAGEEPAAATQSLTVPSDGRYALWARFESPYGFDTRFDIEVQQHGKPVASARFGDRDDAKYWPHGAGNWLIQGPWAYHNTDVVYQRMEADLRAGPATVVLSKGANGKNGAARIVDLICVTSDLEMEPGREMMGWRERGAKDLKQPPIQSRCLRPAWFRLVVPPKAAAPVRASLHCATWEPVGGIGYGPHRDYHFGINGLTQRWRWEKIAPPADEELPPGFDSGWRRIDLSTFGPAWVTASTASSNVPLTLSVSLSADGAQASRFELKDGIRRELFVGTGNAWLEDDVLQGKPAVFFADFLQRYVKELDSEKAGSQARRSAVARGPARSHESREDLR